MSANIVTKGVVLARTDYQEADRILTVLTPNNGKLRLIAKGVRKPKSKLAGGIELFGVNDITVLQSQRELKTLISSRLNTHYGNIVSDIQRTMLGYEFLKQINRVTEDNPGEEYFNLLKHTLEGLDNLSLQPDLTELWFNMQLLGIGGHTPNLTKQSDGTPLSADADYIFNFEEMAFMSSTRPLYGANHIKLLRLATNSLKPSVFVGVKETHAYIQACNTLAKSLVDQAA